MADTCADEKPATGAEKVAVIGIEVALVVLALELASTTAGPPLAAEARELKPIALATSASEVSTTRVREVIGLILYAC